MRLNQFGLRTTAFRTITAIQALTQNDRLVARTGHPTKSLRYFSGKTGLPPEAAVPWTAFYDRVAATVAIPKNENGDPKAAAVNAM